MTGSINELIIFTTNTTTTMYPYKMMYIRQNLKLPSLSQGGLPRGKRTAESEE